MCVTGDLVPLRKRGVIHGIANIVIGAGSGLGGLLGGWVNSVWGWRMAFLIQLPLLLIGAIVVHLTVRVPVKDSKKSALQRMDYFGSLTLSIALVLLLHGVNTGGNVLPWSHPLVLTSLPLAGLFLLIFIYVEEKFSSEPIIPVRLLLNRTVAAACFSYWFTFMSFYGITFYMPVYLQLRGNSPTEAGVRFMASTAGTAFGALGAGVAMRATGNYWYLNKAHHLLSVLGSSLMVSLQFGTPPWKPFLYPAIFGLGLGGTLVTTLMALVGAVDEVLQAVATSAGYAFRSTGSAIGLAVASAAFQNILRVRHQNSIGGIIDADDIIDRIRDNLDEVNLSERAIRESVQESYMQSIRSVFLVTCAFSVLSAFMSVFMRQHVLHSKYVRR
jgi:MFS family permease